MADVGLLRLIDDLTSKEQGSAFLDTTLGSEGLLASLRITSTLQDEGQRVIRTPFLRQGDVHKLLVFLSVVSRVAREGEMDLNRSILCGEDVARAVEVYQARKAYLISHPRLAFLAYTVVLLLRCGTADGDGEQ